MTPTEECVEHGIEFCFEYCGPDWPARIRPDELDIASGVLCVLGQLDLWDVLPEGTDFSRYGFSPVKESKTLDDWILNCHELTDLWRVRVKQLQAQLPGEKE